MTGEHISVEMNGLKGMWQLAFGGKELKRSYLVDLPSSELPLLSIIQ